MGTRPDTTFVEARKRLFTRDEYYRMGETGIFDPDERLELLAGEVFAAPHPTPRHAAAVSILSERLILALDRRAITRVRGPVVLDERSEPLPDLALLTWRDDFYRSGHPRPGDMHLVVEVTDGWMLRNGVDKLALYASCGIPEVWTVDVAARRVESARGPSATGYAVTTAHEPGVRLAPQAFPDVAIDIAEIAG